jgi:hypothetical protein
MINMSLDYRENAKSLRQREDDLNNSRSSFLDSEKGPQDTQIYSQKDFPFLPPYFLLFYLYLYFNYYIIIY